MKKIFFTILILFSFYSISAQVDRSIGTGQYKNVRKPPKKIEVIIEQSIENLKEKLNLDTFQEAIVRNLINDNQIKSNEIIESTAYSNIEKRNLLSEIEEKVNKEIKAILSIKQLEKFEVFLAKNKK